MKKLLVLLLMLALFVGVAIPHIHDDQCGYNPETKTGCIYEEANPLEDKGPFNW